MRVTARYLQHEKCKCKFEKGWHNVIQWVKTLPVNNEDKNVVAVFFNLHWKRDLGSTNLT